MNFSYTHNKIEKYTNIGIEERKIHHEPRHSDLTSMRNINKVNKNKPLYEVTLQKLLSIEDDLVKFKTTKSRTDKFVFPKDKEKRTISVKKKNHDELLQLATKTSQLLKKTPKSSLNNKKKDVKHNLSLLINDAKKELTHRRTTTFSK